MFKTEILLLDYYGGEHRKIFELTEPADVEQAATDAAALAALLDAVSNLAVVRVTLLAPVSYVATSPAVGSNKDIGGTVSGWVEEYVKKASVKFPDPITACRNTDGTLNLSQEALAAFLAAFHTAGIASLSDGEQTVSWIRGRLDEHKVS